VSRWLTGLPWWLVALVCATLGLAPFVPVPHVVEKLGMLARGQLVRPIDWFDLLMHGSPWAVLVGKALVTLRRRSGT
jgi:hypothetical protein